MLHLNILFLKRFWTFMITATSYSRKEPNLRHSFPLTSLVNGTQLKEATQHSSRIFKRKMRNDNITWLSNIANRLPQTTNLLMQLNENYSMKQPGQFHSMGFLY